MTSKPPDPCVAVTTDFLLAELGPSRKRVLEVGCGRGEVAACLQAAGHSVIGIDTDRAAIDSAVARSVDARHVRWLEYGDTARYDAILFTRSLHHLEPLDASVAHAVDLLADDGRVLIDDFAFSDTGADTREWFQTLLFSARANGWCAFGGGVPSFAERLLGGDVTAWHDDHHASIHSASDMAAALGRCFTIERIDETPYLFRYLRHVVGDGELAWSRLRRALEEEQRAAAEGRAELIGRRFVCGKKQGYISASLPTGG